MCYTPIDIRNVNGHYQSVPCGKCDLCVEGRRRAWVFRLQQEAYVSSSYFFITLTFSDEFVPSVFTMEALSLFVKRLRNVVPQFKHFSVGELGDLSLRPHYHMLLFFKDMVSHMFVLLKIRDCWKFGHVSVSLCNDRRIGYITGYCLKKNKRLGSMMRCSKNLGSDFLSDKMLRYLQAKGSCTVKIGGYESVLPRYFRKKLSFEGIRLINPYFPDFLTPTDYKVFKGSQQQKIYRLKRKKRNESI